MTNADKYFRYATDEQLSEILGAIDFQCANCPANSYCYDKYGDIVTDRTMTCKGVICDWLKQENPAQPQKAPLCLSCKHGEIGAVDDFATCYCPHHGYVGQKTECGEYEEKEDKR